MRSIGRTGWGLVLAVVLAGLLLRLWNVGERSLWFDEAFAWRLTQFPFVEMLQRVSRDNSPPLYNVVLHGWVALCGDSVVALRLPSVLFGTLAVVAVFLLVRDAFAEQTEAVPGRALLAAALVASSA